MGREAYLLRLNLGLSSTLPPDWPALANTYTRSSTTLVELPHDQDIASAERPIHECHILLPLILKRSGIEEDWRQFSLYVVCGDWERCFGLEEKPRQLFRQLVAEGKKPAFVLRKHVPPLEGFERKTRSEGLVSGTGEADSNRLSSDAAQRPRLGLDASTRDSIEIAQSLTESIALENDQPGREHEATQFSATYYTEDDSRVMAYGRLYDSKGRPVAKHIRDLDLERCLAMNSVMGLGVKLARRDAAPMTAEEVRRDDEWLDTVESDINTRV